MTEDHRAAWKKALAARAKAAQRRRGKHRRTNQEETDLVRIKSRPGMTRWRPPGPGGPAAA